MTRLIVSGWQPSLSWADSWSRSNLAQRIGTCTSLSKTEVKRLVRRIAARENLDIEILDVARAQPAIHALESMGAAIQVL